jgi:hypothetical protein
VNYKYYLNKVFLFRLQSDLSIEYIPYLLHYELMSLLPLKNKPNFVVICAELSQLNFKRSEKAEFPLYIINYSPFFPLNPP